MICETGQRLVITTDWAINMMIIGCLIPAVISIFNLHYANVKNYFCPTFCVSHVGSVIIVIITTIKIMLIEIFLKILS